MIVHIFKAEWYHLTPNFVKAFQKYIPEEEHIFILYGTNSLDKDRYNEIFKEFSSNNYAFCTTYWDFILLMYKYRKAPILFHAGEYHWFWAALLFNRNVNWVCWGGGVSKGSSLLGKLNYPNKRFIYKRFSTIVTLMDDDKKSLCENYYLISDKIHVISYFGSDNTEEVIERVLSLNKPDNKKPIILLGNNPHNITDYIKYIKILSMYKGRIKVQCMLNYSLVRDEVYNELIRLGASIYGDDFHSNEEFYEGMEAYIKYMNNCDIYICGSDAQTGLGAISTCLRLGKKIYITGKNYNWIKSKYKSIVFDARSITSELAYDEFIKPISTLEKEHNILSMRIEIDDAVQPWRNYLNHIENKS